MRYFTVMCKLSLTLHICCLCELLYRLNFMVLALDLSNLSEIFPSIGLPL